MSGSRDLSIILVTWNMRELAPDSLASIEAAELELSYEVIHFLPQEPRSRLLLGADGRGMDQGRAGEPAGRASCR